MEVVNRSRLEAEVITALDKGGREYLVIVAKATYCFDGSPSPSLAPEQKPVMPNDIFVAEAGTSAPIYESDFAPRKTRCDLLLDATAYTADGREVTELPIGVQIGSYAKKLLVVGDRVWRKGAFGVEATKPRPFSAMRIHYGRAFGGSPKKKQRSKDGRVEEDTYWSNPIGTGYAPSSTGDLVDGMPLPNTEDFTDRVMSPSGSYQPLAFGPIGRHWDPRRRYAGTYDAAWRETTFPFLPDDFDEAFFQAAPPDQQIDFPRGGEPVALHHLVPGRAITTFKLPKPELSVKVLSSSRRGLELIPVVDTLFIEPSAGLLTYVYRCSMALDRKGIHGVELVAAGPVCEKWWTSKVLGTADCGCGGDSSQDPITPPDPSPSESAAQPAEQT